MTRLRVLTAWLALTSVGLVLLAIAYGFVINRVGANQQADTRALCAFRADVLQRVESGKRFLVSHPHGFPGISASEIQASLSAELRTVHALHALICPSK